MFLVSSDVAFQGPIIKNIRREREDGVGHDHQICILNEPEKIEHKNIEERRKRKRKRKEKRRYLHIGYHEKNIGGCHVGVRGPKLRRAS